MAFPIIEFLRSLPSKGIILDSELPNEPGVVPVFSQQGGVRPGPLFFVQLVGGGKTDAMHSFMHTREQRSAAWGASRLGNVSIAKTHTVLYEHIEIGGLDPRMSHYAQAVVPLIVGQQEDDVGPLLSTC